MISTAWFALNPNWMVSQIERSTSAAGMDPQMVELQKAMLTSMLPMSILIGVVTTLLLCGGLAIAQWKMVTRAIPIIVLVWSAYAILAGLVKMLVPLLDMTAPLPLWLSLLNWSVFTACLVLNVAGYRGAKEFRRLSMTA